MKISRRGFIRVSSLIGLAVFLPIKIFRKAQPQPSIKQPSIMFYVV